MAEIIVEPSALSKIIPISFKINDTDSITTTRLATKKQFNTTDTDAWLSFTLEGIDASLAGEYDLTMINVDENQSSIVNHTNIAFSGIPFHYKMDSSADLTKNEIRHAGRWMGQIVVRLTNGDTTTRQFDFAITGHLLDGNEARLILIEDYNALMATITTSKDELAQYNIDYAALIETVTTQEAARVQAELTRAQTFDALVESEMVAQNVATKLTEKEATYAPRLFSVEQQLEQTQAQFNQAVGAVTEDSEVVLARNEYPTLKERLDAEWDNVNAQLADYATLENRVEQIINTDLDSIREIVKSDNLYNPNDDDVQVGVYTYYDGNTEADTNYLTTGYIPVSVGKIVKFCGVDPLQEGFRRTIGQITAFDIEKRALSDKGGMNVTSLTVADGVAYVRLCFKKTWTNVIIQETDDVADISYTPYFTPYTRIIGLDDVKNDVAALKLNLYKTNNAVTTGDYLSNCKQSLKKNVLVSYCANFDTFTSLKIGYTGTDTYSTGYTDYFEITATDFIMHRKDLADLTWQHGLTISKFISVQITFDFSMNYTLTITTIRGTYTKTNYIYLGKRYYPFAIITGTSVINNKLSMSCKDLRKNIFIFGDSYISNSSARWIYYLTNKDNVCINGYAGESSASATNDFDTLVSIGSPKFVLWCLGMNDGTDADENTPSAGWLTAIQHVIDVCKQKNIVPILATIPSVPTINNDGKNKWVRESGYNYIDFAQAVNSDANGNWYSGLLSTDNVHPTEAGAKVLYARAVTDFPDLLINN